MPIAKKKKDIIKKIKDYIKRSGRPIERGDDWGVTGDVANKIQAGIFEISKLPLEKKFNPPYMEIAEQLQAENDQIFEAAVYNLTKIAINNANYRKHIAQLIEDSINNTNHGEYQKNYASAKLELIK